MASYFADSAISVEIGKINRKSHPERMYGFTRHDPHPFSRPKPGSSKQALVAPCGVVGDFGGSCQHGLTGQVRDLKADDR
jgi:hypothetical protein